MDDEETQEPIYLSRTEEQSQTVLTSRMVEQDFLGAAANLTKDDFKYNEQFEQVLKKKRALQKAGLNSDEESKVDPNDPFFH